MNFTSFSYIRSALKINEWAIIGRLTSNYITQHLAFIYEVTTTFITCAKEARELCLDIPINVELVRPILREIEREI